MLDLKEFLDIECYLTESGIVVPEPDDAGSQSADNIALSIISTVNQHPMSNDKSLFYAGITNNVKQNMYRHKNRDYVALVKCKDRETAGKVEEILADYNFDCGERPNNGGKPSTNIVYVIYKDENFKS